MAKVKKGGYEFYVDATTGSRKFDGKTTLGFVGFVNGREVLRGFRELSVEMNIFHSELAAVADLLGRLLKMRDEIFGGNRSPLAGRSACRSVWKSRSGLVVGAPITVYGDNQAVVNFVARVQQTSDAEFDRLCRRDPARKATFFGLRRLLAVFPKLKMRYVRGCENHADAPSRKITVAARPATVAQPVAPGKPR